MFKKHSCIALLIFLSACSTEEYTVHKNCIGQLEDFDGKILMKSVNMPFSYIIDGTSIKVKFADRKRRAALIMQGGDNKTSLIHNTDGNYFVHLLNQTGMIEYEFDSDRWFVGVCK